jgi:hypothetical protein
VLRGTSPLTALAVDLEFDLHRGRHLTVDSIDANIARLVTHFRGRSSRFLRRRIPGDICHCLDGNLDVCTGDIQVRYGPDLALHLAHANAMPKKRGEEGRIRDAHASRREKHHVRLRLRISHDDPFDRGQASCQALGIAMIFLQALDMVIERVQASRPGDPCLTHRTSEHVLDAPRPREEAVGLIREQNKEVILNLTTGLGSGFYPEDPLLPINAGRERTSGRRRNASSMCSSSSPRSVHSTS